MAWIVVGRGSGRAGIAVQQPVGVAFDHAVCVGVEQPIPFAVGININLAFVVSLLISVEYLKWQTFHSAIS